MTNQQHPIIPPPELVQQWVTEAHSKDAPPGTCPNTRIIINRAVEWGANQELEACCRLLDNGEHAATYGCHNGDSLRAARRPKPPSLAEEALVGLEMIDECAIDQMRHCTVFDELYIHKDIIRRALERLQQLEDQQ